MKIYGKEGSRGEIYIEYENKKYIATGELLHSGDFWIYGKESIMQIEPTIEKGITIEEFEKIKKDISEYNKKVRFKVVID